MDTKASVPKPLQSEKPQPNISPNEAVGVVVSEMRRGSLSQATYNYLNCVDNCYKSYGEGSKENMPFVPPSSKKKKRPSLTKDGRRNRFRRWKIKNTLLNRCLLRCKNQWNRAVINLIGGANFRLNEDVLNHILSMLIKPVKKRTNITKKKKTNSNTKPTGKGGRKTRRKKGTKKKPRKRGKQRKSKRRN